ncbi:MAG: hypothetical protein ACK4TF_06230 [Thermodesulfovibrionales bacterium]
MELLERLKAIEDPVKRKAYFIGLISQEIKKKGGLPPVIVGGMAVEIYTQGSYTTGDIDLKAEKDLLEKTLTEWNFVKSGRIWFNEELDIYIDWLGSTLDEGKEAQKRVNRIIIGEGLEINVLSIEDLIIDRLNAYKWWKDEDSLVWAKVLLKVKEATGEPVDRDYLTERALEEGLNDVIKEVI